jgi:glucokinase
MTTGVVALPHARIGRGSPSSEVPLREAGALTVGVDVGGTKIALAVVAPDGRVLASHRHDTDPTRRPEDVAADIARCIRTCLGEPAQRATAVGIGVAGQIGVDGMVLGAPNLHWRNFPLGKEVEQRTGLPVTVTNDVRAATFGEWRFGVGSGERDLLCVFVGTGVGGGIVADGHLRYGSSGTSGEIGHMTIVANGRRCHCSNLGCLEAYVGGWAIAERAHEAVSARPDLGSRLLTLAGGIEKIHTDLVREAYRESDPLARELVRDTVEYLAAGLVSVVNAFNPHVLVLGGGVIEGLPEMIPQAEAIVRNRALPAAVTNLRIRKATLGVEAGVIGAAAFARWDRHEGERA